MRFGAFYAVRNISIPFLSENAPKLKYVQTKGILGMQGHSRNAKATQLQGQQGCKGFSNKKKSLRRGSKQRGDLHLIVYIVTL